MLRIQIFSNGVSHGQHVDYSVGSREVGDLQQLLRGMTVHFGGTIGCSVLPETPDLLSSEHGHNSICLDLQTRKLSSQICTLKSSCICYNLYNLQFNPSTHPLMHNCLGLIHQTQI